MSATAEPSGSADELQEVFENSDDPVLTAVEVAEQLEITQQAAHAKLTKANESGWVDRKKVGSRAVVWWVER